MAGAESSWIQAFSTDQYASIVHMDGAAVGHYLAMTFPTEQTFNGFRFECGGNNDGRNIEQNVFDLQYHDGSDWVTVGTTNSADGHCGSLDTPGYAMWPAAYSSTQWRFILTEQHGGPWYHGFAWYSASGNAVATTGGTCTPTDIIAGQARDFEGGMGGWSCYSNPDSGVGQGNCHTHSNYNGRSSVAHIHGGCTGSQGGIQQTFSVSTGATYNLKFLAFAGTWDGTDTDDLHVKVEGSDQSNWVQYSVAHGAWDTVELSFAAQESDVTITIWSDINHCIDVDEIELEVCTDCVTTDLISGQARDFEGGMGGWSCYSNPDSSVGQGNCHTHANYNGRTSVAHIHGGCTGSQGGIQQTFATTYGNSYTLKLLAFAGTWDGTDTDDFYIKVENSDQAEWVQYSVEHSTWAEASLAFKAYGEVTITIWSDINHCIDVDEIVLEMCSSCRDTTLITGQASDFEGGMGGWSCYDNGNAGHGNCHTHSNYNGRSSVAHIHGGCGGSQGGIQQTFETQPGTSYHLLFVAYAGTWDGTDTDDLHIKVSNSDKEDWVAYSIEHSEWRTVDHRFTASGPVTITIWADVAHCIDVDDIILQACTNEADVVTMEECSDGTDNLPMSSVTGQRSSVSGDVVSIVIDYPGYMDLVSLSFVNGDNSPLDSWTVTVDDGCQNDNNAAQDFSYSSLTPVVTRSGAFAEIGVTATFAYYTHSELTESAERVTETKDIEFGIRAPLTHVTSVTAPFQQGTGLVYDIESHGIVDEEDKQVVYVEFRTFVLDGQSFTGDCSVSSPYFSTETAECTTSSTEDFDHPTLGSGSIQTWMVRVQNPDQCQDATHTERIDVDLTLASGKVERIEFMVDMVDEAGPDCRVVIGDFDLTSSVQISDGSAWVDPAEANDMIFYLNNVMELSVTFDSLMLPTYATLESMTVTQNDDTKCGSDCFDVIQFVCENCDANRKSPGATYTFSVVLTDDVFTGLPATSTDTTFELNFGLQYTDRRRRLAKTVDAHTVPIKVSLRDYDCKAPNAILSSVETVNCDVASMTKMMICSSQGWKDLSQCSAPAERYFSIIGMAASALVVLYLISKAAVSSKNIFKYEQVPLEIQA